MHLLWHVYFILGCYFYANVPLFQSVYHSFQTFQFRKQFHQNFQLQKTQKLNKVSHWKSKNFLISLNTKCINLNIVSTLVLESLVLWVDFHTENSSLIKIFQLWMNSHARRLWRFLASLLQPKTSSTFTSSSSKQSLDIVSFHLIWIFQNMINWLVMNVTLFVCCVFINWGLTSCND